MAIMDINKLLRVVIDTNIIVSSLIGKGGASYKVMERFKQNHFVMYLNGNLMKEYDNKINQLLRENVIKDVQAAGTMLNEIRSRSVALKIPIDPPIRSTDPKDNCVLEVAFVGVLDFIITNDSRDLLSLDGSKALGKTRVVKPLDFIEKLNEHGKK